MRDSILSRLVRIVAWAAHPRPRTVTGKVTRTRPRVHTARGRRVLLCCAPFIVAPPSAFAEQRIDLLVDGLQSWQAERFKGETQYRWITLDGRGAIEARSRASASGLVQKRKIDLTKTPYLHWRWRVMNTYAGNDETRKSGDDYPARVYVVVSGGLMFWRTRAVNYVWASRQPSGSSWPNAYTANARMLALRSGDHGLGEWREERRDVRADLRRLLGEDITHVDAVAIMTDSDDTGQEATAYYQALYFSDE